MKLEEFWTTAQLFLNIYFHVVFTVFTLSFFYVIKHNSLYLPDFNAALICYSLLVLLPTIIWSIIKLVTKIREDLWISATTNIKKKTALEYRLISNVIVSFMIAAFNFVLFIYFRNKYTYYASLNTPKKIQTFSYFYTLNFLLLTFLYSGIPLAINDLKDNFLIKK